MMQVVLRHTKTQLLRCEKLPTRTPQPTPGEADVHLHNCRLRTSRQARLEALRQRGAVEVFADED